jgi:rhodanese-related sulfurtransferase/membrane protein insertase Oxa1/YidC/SpoIIIJ
VVLVGGTIPAFAIPSPELIVGSFTSISQLVALVSAMLGGGAAFVGVRAGKQQLARRAWQVAAGAMVCLAISLGVNFYQFSNAQAERQERLEATLTRPTPRTGDSTLDPMLKEVSYRDQITSQLGISTDEAEQLLAATQRGERNDTLFLDIREASETEMGSLPAAKAIRFPDLPNAKLNLSSKKVILFCHNGNRSYETCAALAAKGIDCRFMVGGLEKWLVEHKPLTGLNARTLADLRAVPAHRNQATLLDTARVRNLLQEGAIFVDVRYPGEFSANHLPGAINLPIRPTPSDELRERIRNLPKRPIIAPCYDRRSCFFGEILGLELDRAGYDFRGRYTVPWEYFVASTPPPHIQEWLQQAHRTLWDKAVATLAGAVRALADQVGLALAIVLLAFASRLLVLPVSLKAERDQLRSRAAADELKAINAGFKDDPVRRTRAIREFYSRHGLTPLRNLLALAFLPIMALALNAVQSVSTETGGHFLWIPNVAERDSVLILPVVFAGLLGLYLEMAFVSNRTHRLLVWGLGFPLLIATGALFSAGADLYLAVSAALLLLQRVVVAGEAERLRSLWHRLRYGKDVISLDEPKRLAEYGKKAHRLALMRAHGLPVPPGMLLTPAFLELFAAATPASRRRTLNRLWSLLGSGALAVRSSATSEDNENHSFAGVFESVLNVRRDNLEDAILRVRASFDSDRARTYTAHGGKGSILIQRMVDAEFAGVLFTRDPLAGALAMIELVRGTADAMVSGAVRPATYRLGRVSGNKLSGGEAPVDLQALLTLGIKAEQLFSSPQDVEWAYQRGRFYLVQSRDITRVIADSSDVALKHAELARALDLADGVNAEEVLFSKNEFSEMLPRPTPLSLSLMESLWDSGGSVDLAARKLGISYQASENALPYFVTILGRLYINAREERRRVLKFGPLAARKIVRSADALEKNFRIGFLPDF